MDPGPSLAKYMLFFFNLLFAVLGVAMVVIGVIIRTKLVNYHDFIEYDLSPYPILLIGVGCVVFFIAYLGCCGAIKENSCMLCLYAIILIIIVGVEIGFVVAANAKKDALEEIVDKRLKFTINSIANHTDSSVAYYESWHLLQTELKCCGIVGPEDWKNVLPKVELPGSCCQKAANDTTCTVNTASKTGCKAAIIDFLNSNIVTVIGVAIVVAVVQLDILGNDSEHLFNKNLYKSFKQVVIDFQASKMDLGVTFTKYVVFFFNFLFAIIGIGMVVTGFIVRTKFIDYHDFIEYDLTPYPILLIVVGFVVFLIAFFGCCGAIKENTCMLFLYSLIMIMIVLFQIGIVVAALSKKGDLEQIVDKRLLDTLKKSKDNSKLLKSWDLLQNELHCCGVSSMNDWSGVIDSDPTIMPGSCCHKGIDDKTCRIQDVKYPGCKTAFLDYLNNNMYTVAIFAIVAALVQVLAIIFSCCLYSVYRRGTRSYSY
ncbi:uncharacterized protein LOC116343455 [Contarinia nasturtii]|uniref:uncharacterized protein LOC116343455 n=1 Tax=Contarinia nasturtii TaxID=265458 RepID=UPI0012D460DC|nr:uncharacterized protein LOC116343455 [Contarinia nasturtii]